MGLSDRARDRWSLKPFCWPLCGEGRAEVIAPDRRVPGSSNRGGSWLGSLPDRLRAFAWRPAIFAVAVGATIALAVAPDGARGDRNRALVGALAKDGLAVANVAWVDEPPRGIVPALTVTCRALVRASAHGEPNDLYLVRARLSPEGALVGIAGVSNLTRTPSADESAPLVDGQLAVYTAAIEGVTTSVFAL